ncbi:MAG: helix-turn-helix transcriptional regulator [Sphingomonadales bacterium]|nr:helix-turn-helix transcriptional regulator [Sphingomonadales bacterium]
MAKQGAVTTSAVQEAAKLSTGSLYHRFGSREGLLAETWAFALLSFQPQFVEALAVPDKPVGEIAAVTPRFCREHRAQALILSCCNARQFMSEDTPHAIRLKIEEANQATGIALKEFAQRRGFDLDACRLALIAFPLAAVQQYLPDREVPLDGDQHVAHAAHAMLESEE